MEITGHGISTKSLYKASQAPREYHLSSEARAKLEKSRQYLQNKVNQGQTMYGINTGFGAFSSVKISDSQLENLQINLIRSHCCGAGDLLSIEQSRATMILRANTLARGTSGVRPEVVDTILSYLSKDIIPIIPSQGSVGASGDLAPLAHLALGLIGEGRAWYKGQIIDTKIALQQAAIQPLQLKFKEGLSLINGCQVMTAIGLRSLYEAQRILKSLNFAAAMSLEALRGSRKAFDVQISQERPHPGEIEVAAQMREILQESSPISLSHLHCNKVQDAYSLRCIPAVHGAANDAIRYAIQVLETEANSSTDNPLVFVDTDKVVSCGNFHGEPVAMALDFASMAMSVAASISQCRISLLVNPAMSELPAFLAKDGGLNSGHMIVQVAAASLVSENKVLSHPACVDSIPTSADKEDHVSMGTIAARKFTSILRNTEKVVAMEYLSAAQALEFLKPLVPSQPIQEVYEVIRQEVPNAEVDRIFSEDIESIVQKMRQELI